MVERKNSKTPASNDIVLFDAQVNKHLFKVGGCIFKIFWICGKLFVSKALIPHPLMHYAFGFGIEDEIDAGHNIGKITYHTCAFALLLTKNLVLKLI